jgi:uncharacterized protein DUF6570
LPRTAKVSTLDGDGVESDIFEDDGVFEDMPNTSGAAIPEQDWSFLEQFNRRFDENQPETCTVCNERWFDMNLKPNGQCGRCDKASRLNQINRLSAENYMDPGEFPAHLPKLDNTEEMLIARCHVHVQVQRFRTNTLGIPYISCRTLAKCIINCLDFLEILRLVDLSNTLW